MSTSTTNTTAQHAEHQASDGNGQQTAATTPNPEASAAVEFLKAIFQPGDRILLRPIETWTEDGKKKSQVDYDGIEYQLVGGKDQAGNWQPDPQRLATTVKRHNKRSEKTKCNVFFGVCPRFGGGGKFNQAWQIRVVRALWSDVDDSTPAEAIERCKAAGIPEPSIVVASGRGAHLYWLLAEPYLIEDGDPRPVLTDWVDQGEGKKRKPRKYVIEVGTGAKVYIDGKDAHNAPSLSPKAQHVQDILAGIAAKIGGDHTTDLARLLRVPGTLNRKDQRNGREPVPCTLVECDPTRCYPIGQFAQYAEASPDRARRESIGKVKLPVSRKLSPTKRDRFHELLLTCDAAEVGSRSEADYALCAWAIENGVPRETAWAEAQNVGKFKEAGERYFLLTWEKAESKTRRKIFDKVQGKAQRKAGKNQQGHLMSENPEAFPLTDTGLAERFALQHGDNVRYCHQWAKWLAWDGTRWKIDDQGAVDQLAKQTARSILREAADERDDDRREALVNFAKSAESAAKRDAMLKLARSEPPIPITPDALDKDPWIFNCPNGKLDLHTAQLCEHRHEDYVTKLCPVEYHPNALCPTWLAALDRIFSGDSELIDFLQRFVGHSLTGDVSEQVLSIWHGVGANGKSTVANTIMEMLGPDYSMKAPADLLLQKRDSEHPTALTDLHGKRFVACIETDDGRRLAESLVKELTGGDPIRARRMREDFWQFWPTHKVVLACNHRPTVRGTDHAIWRRLKLVPFNVVIPPAERDKDLPAKLREELPGILAWAVRGCLDWQRHGLGEPKAVIDATAGYQTAEDTLLNFITDCCVMGPENRVKAADLLDAYRTWSGDKYMTVRKLTAMLTERGVERHKSNGLWYRGLGLLTSGTTKQRNDFTP